MPTTNSPKPAIIPVRLMLTQVGQIADMVNWGLGNQSEIIREAISRMYREEQEKRAVSEPTPKYFVPMNSEPAITSGRNATIGKIVGEDFDAYGYFYYLVSFGTDNPEIWYPGDGNIAYDKKQADTLVRAANRRTAA